MLGIMKKNIRTFIYFPAIVFAAMTWYWISSKETLGVEIAAFNGFYIFFIAIWAVLAVEQAEERYNGYLFLSTLPLRVRDVVAAKFALPFLLIALSVLLNFVLFERFPAEPDILARCRGIALASGAGGILLVALVYLAIYRFGVKTLFVMFGVIIFMLNVVGLLAVKGMLPGVARFFGMFASVTPGAGLYVWVFAAVAAFFGLMAVAIRIKSARRI